MPLTLPNGDVLADDEVRKTLSQYQYDCPAVLDLYDATIGDAHDEVWPIDLLSLNALNAFGAGSPMAAMTAAWKDREKITATVRAVTKAKLESLTPTEVEAQVPLVEQALNEREFTLGWDRAVQTFEHASKEARSGVKASVLNRISRTSLTSMRAMAKELPTFIGRTIENELASPAQRMEEVLGNESRKLQATYPAIEVKSAGEVTVRTRAGHQVVVGGLGGAVAVATGVGLAAAGSAAAAGICTGLGSGYRFHCSVNWRNGPSGVDVEIMSSLSGDAPPGDRATPPATVGPTGQPIKDIEQPIDVSPPSGPEHSGSSWASHSMPVWAALLLACLCAGLALVTGLKIHSKPAQLLPVYEATPHSDQVEPTVTAPVAPLPPQPTSAPAKAKPTGRH